MAISGAWLSGGLTRNHLTEFATCRHIQLVADCAPARQFELFQNIVHVVFDCGRADPQPLGDITLVDFINYPGLQPIGGNLFLETVASGNPIEGTPGENGLGTLKQGMLENSNVDIVEEMVNMITTQRAYEMNSKVVSTADQMLQYITQNL